MENLNEPENYTTRSDVEELASAILEVVAVASSHGVDCWLCYGALLGMVRERRLLPWNNDAHLLCWHDDSIGEKMVRITDELNERGYNAFYYSTYGALIAKKKDVDVAIDYCCCNDKYAVRPHEGGASRGPFFARLYYWAAVITGAYSGSFKKLFRRLPACQYVKILIIGLVRLLPAKFRRKLFLYFMERSEVHGGFFQKTAIPKEYFDDFEMCEFYGKTVRVPVDPERLLRFIYGDNWRVPIEQWSFYSEENKSETGIIFLNEKWDYSRVKII